MVADMKIEGEIFRSGAIASILLAFAIPIAQAQEQLETNQLLVPEDLTIQTSDEAKPGENGNPPRYEEVRIGGRLERVTVRHQVGITEIYQNRRDDELWSADERELGDVQNVRQWKLSGW